MSFESFAAPSDSLDLAFETPADANESAVSPFSSQRKRACRRDAEGDDDLMCDETMDVRKAFSSPSFETSIMDYSCLTKAPKTASCRPHGDKTSPHEQIRGISDRVQTLFDEDPVAFLHERVAYDKASVKISDGLFSVTFPVSLAIEGSNCPSRVPAYAKVFFKGFIDNERERKTYDCFTHDIDSCFFVAPLCVGDVPIDCLFESTIKMLWMGLAASNRTHYGTFESYMELNCLGILFTENCNPSRQKNNVTRYINEQYADTIVVQMFHALQTLRENNMCHGDLHSDNILFPEAKDIGLERTGTELYFNETSKKMSTTLRNADFECPRVVKIFDWDRVRIVPEKQSKLIFLDTIAFVKTLLFVYKGPRIWDPPTDQLRKIMRDIEYWQDPHGNRTEPNAKGARRFDVHVDPEDVNKMSPEDLSVVMHFFRNAYQRSLASILRGGRYRLSPFFVVRHWSGDMNDFGTVFARAYNEYDAEQTKENPGRGFLGLHDPGPDGSTLAQSALVYTRAFLNFFFQNLVLQRGEQVTPHFVVEHANWDDEDKFDLYAEAFKTALTRWESRNGEKMTLYTRHPAPGRTETLIDVIKKSGVVEIANAVIHQF